MEKRPAVFVDRDGTLIEEVNFLHRVEDLRLFDFTAEAVTQLNQAGYLVIVVTNQSGIGRGIFTEADMHGIHDAIQQQLDNAIDAFYYCPHLPCDGCACRKPGRGMIDSALRDFALDLENSWIIGDKRTDVETGQNAGISSGLVLTGYGEAHQAELKREPEATAQDLLKLTELILSKCV